MEDGLDEEELRQLSGEVIGAAIEVHRILGPGYLESIYEEALALELKNRGIPFERQVPVDIIYKGAHIGQRRLDLLVIGKLIVELKTVEALAPIQKAQAISYLKATGYRFALIINFNFCHPQRWDKKDHPLLRLIFFSVSLRLRGSIFSFFRYDHRR